MPAATVAQRARYVSRPSRLHPSTDSATAIDTVVEVRPKTKIGPPQPPRGAVPTRFKMSTAPLTATPDSGSVRSVSGRRSSPCRAMRQSSTQPTVTEMGRPPRKARAKTRRIHSGSPRAGTSESAASRRRNVPLPQIKGTLKAMRLRKAARRSSPARASGTAASPGAVGPGPGVGTGVGSWVIGRILRWRPICPPTVRFYKCGAYPLPVGQQSSVVGK